MLEKGSFSFVALLVVNPMLILLFQNCSFAPVSQSSVMAKSGNSQSRMVSSVGIMDKAAPGTKARKAQAACDANKDLCPGVKNE